MNRSKGYRPWPRCFRSTLQVFRRRRESELIRAVSAATPLAASIREQIYGEREGPAKLGPRKIWPDHVQVGPAVRPQDIPEVPRRGLEPAVLDSPFLERPNARDAIVRLSEHELAKQADGDEQHGHADERDQELRPNLHGQAGDAPHERVADPSPPSRRRPAAPAPRPRSQTSRTVVPPTMFVISHSPSIRATSKSAVVADATSPVLTSTKWHSKCSVPRSPLTVISSLYAG